MSGISETVLQQVAVWGVAISVAIYLFLGYLTSHRGFDLQRADSFLRYRHGGTEGPGVTSTGLRNTLMAGAFSLASAVYVYVEWGANQGLIALWSPLTWFLGVLVLWWFSSKIYQQSRKEWTLHAFLGNKYRQSQGARDGDQGWKKNRVTKITSAVTIAFFLLQIAAEVFVGLSVLNSFVFTEFSQVTVAGVLVLVLVAYAIIGGLPSVLHTDTFQFWLIIIAIVAAAVTLFNAAGGEAWGQLIEKRSTAIPDGLQDVVIIISLFALNLPLLITDMSVWQRISAVESERAAKEATFSFAGHLLIWRSILVIIGTGFGGLVQHAGGAGPVEQMLTYLSDTVAYPLLIVGFFAAILSTADTFLISAAQTAVVDWQYADVFRRVEYDPEMLEEATHREMTQSARFSVAILGIVGVGIGYWALESFAVLVTFLFSIFAVPIAMAPALIFGLIADQGDGAKEVPQTLPEVNRYSESAAFTSVAWGFCTALTLFVLALAGVRVWGVSVAYWNPIVVALVSTAFFVAIQAGHESDRLAVEAADDGSTAD